MNFGTLVILTLEDRTKGTSESQQMILTGLLSYRAHSDTVMLRVGGLPGFQ